MVSTRIPPELFDDILACVVPTARHALLNNYEDRQGRQRTLQHLSSCSSVCVHWANFIRPHMFQILVLRSAKDLYGLLALLRMPYSPRIWSIADCLRMVAVMYWFHHYFWCHNLQRLQAEAAREELVFRIHIHGRAPCVRNKECTVRHPLFHTIPRIIPFHRQPMFYVDLIIKHVEFPDGAGLFSLIRDIRQSGILLRSLICEAIHWDGEFPSSLTSLDPIFPLSQARYIQPPNVITMVCTDSNLAAFAAHSYIGHRSRDVLMLNPSDATRFLDIFSEWASLTRSIDMAHHPIRSRAFDASPRFGREGDSQLSNPDQVTIGHSWKIHSHGLSADRLQAHRRRHAFHDIVEFSVYMRPEQGHAPGSVQMAYICSIVIDISDTLADQRVDWNTILYKALEFPMMDTLKVSVHGRDALRDFVRRHHGTLTVADSQGRLRLCLLEGEEYSLQDKYRQQVDLSVVILDLTNIDELATMGPPEA